MSKNVAIYARVSTDLQAEQGYSLQTQIDACTNRAHELGAQTIKNYIDDGYSGSYIERPAMDSLREALRSNVYDTVICYDPDRLSRNLSHQLIITDDIDRAGAKLVFVSVQFEQSPEGRLFYAIRGAISGYEREKIRERTMRGKRGKLKAGKVITDSHVYGYDFNKETSQYVVNPYEADVIHKIYHWYLVEQIGGGDVIAQRLEDEGIPSPTGKTTWSSTTVRKILRREMYTGKYYTQTYYHKKNGPNKETRIPRDKADWIAMTVDPIINQETHIAACELMDKKRTYKLNRKINTQPYLLQGLLVCGNCGNKMSVITRKQISKYYACASRLPHNSSTPCKARYSKIEVVDQLFWNMLTDVCKNNNSLVNYIGTDITPLPQKEDPRKKLSKQLSKIHAEQQAVMNWFGQSLITQSVATEKLAALKTKENDLTARLNRITDSKITKTINTKRICSMVKKCPETFEARRNVVLSIIESISFLRTDTNYGRNYELDIKIKFK